MKIRIAIAIVSLLGLGLLPEQSVAQQRSARAEQLTLDHALDVALGENTQVKNSALDTSRSDDDVDAARTLRLPRLNLYVLGSQQVAPLDFNFARGSLGTLPGVGPIPNEDVSISTPRKPTAVIVGQAQQPLSQLYKINLGIKQLELRGTIASERERLQRATTAEAVKLAYFGVLRNQAGTRALDESIAFLRELDRETARRADEGEVLPSTSLEVKARLAKAESDATALRNLLETQREQLNQLLGRPVDTSFEVVEVPSPTAAEGDLAEARRRAVARRPEIRMADLGVDAARLQIRVKKSEYIPDVGVGLTYISPQNFNSIVPKTFLSAGLIVSWDVFDWGKRRSEIRSSKIDAEKAQNAAGDARDQVLIDVGDKWRRVQQTRTALGAADVARETAKENLRVALARFEYAAATKSDVLQAQAGLAQAENDYQQALLALWSATAALQRAMGEER